jgi:histone H3/H4
MYRRGHSRSPKKREKEVSSVSFSAFCDMDISNEARKILNRLCKDTVAEATRLALLNKRPNITKGDLQTALRLLAEEMSNRAK